MWKDGNFRLGNLSCPFAIDIIHDWFIKYDIEKSHHLGKSDFTCPH